MKKTLLKLLLLLVAGSSIAGPCQAFSWPWGQNNFEECVADGMKDRASDQISIVRSACRKKFSATPNFTNLDHVGTLSCVFTNNMFFRVEIGFNAINVGKLNFQIMDRTKEKIHGKLVKISDLPDGYDENTTINFNFETGLGFIDFTQKPTYHFECHQ
jgi:hypothetical protein